MSKIGIFTDLHLGVHQNSTFWIDIALNWAHWYKKELQDKNIKDVIFCGDFFHYRDEVSLVSLNAANTILDIFKDFNLYMITGNHDCYYKQSSEINSLSILKGRKNVHVYDEITVLDNLPTDKKIVLCPWGTKIKDIPEADIVFGHFELQNFKFNSFKVCDHGDNVEDLLEKSSLIFSGHFHLRDEKKFDNKTVVYAGNPFEMDFGDAYQTKGYYILDLDTLKYEFTENNISPKHLKIYLSKLIKTTNVDKEFNKILPNNLVKVVVDKNISSDHLELLVGKMSSFKPNDLHVDYDVNYNKLKFNDQLSLDLSGVDIVKAIEEFVNLLDISNKKEVVDYTISLYNKSKL